MSTKPRRNAPSLSLVIPFYNEAAHLPQFLTTLSKMRFSLKTEFIFVDDGSTDGSAQIVRRHRFAGRPCRIISISENTGKGAAVRAGLAAARGDIVGIQDADLEYDISDINRLIEPIVSGRCEVVFGTRFAPATTNAHRTVHRLANRVLTLFSNMLSGLALSDMETCYKFGLRQILQNINLESDRFGLEPELTAKLARLRIRIREIPIAYYPRGFVDGKKITWKDGVAALWHLVYFNQILSKKKFFKETMPMEFLTEKTKWW